jgi:hypothetical protein
LSYVAYNETLQLQEKQKLDMDNLGKAMSDIEEIRKRIGI